MKNDHKLAHLPVVIFSTSAQQTAIDKTFETGAWLYLRKPDTFNKLRTMLETILIVKANQGFSQPPKADFLINI
jgi:CheY-like chemotaxis protein